MVDPYSWASQGRGQIDSLAPPASTAGRNVRDILEEDEDPSAFESLFRFIGRPGFMVRTLLSGDLSGFVKNTAQFGKELALPMGIFNHGLLPGGDWTSAEDRPEGSDLLHRWGVIKNKTSLGSWEKLGIDLGVGVVTDPLSLVGGGGGKLGTTGAKLSGLPFRAARQNLAGALRRGAEAPLMERFTSEIARGVQRVASRTGTAPGFEALSGVKSLDDIYKLAETLPSGGKGLTSPLAAKIAREVEGAAAERLFFSTLKQAEQEGVQIRHGLQGRLPDLADEAGFGRWLSGDASTAAKELTALRTKGSVAALLPQVGQTLPDGTVAYDLAKFLGSVGDEGKLANTMLNSKNLKSAELSLGQKVQVLYRPEHERFVQRAVERINEAVKNVQPGATSVAAQGPVRSGAGSFRTIRNGLRDLGLSDDFTVPFLQRQFPFLDVPSAGSLDDYVKLGHDLPLSLADAGVEALVKAGMAPGGGLSIRPFWSDNLGKALERAAGWHYRNGYNYIPWSDVAGATGPGFIGNVLRRFGHSPITDSGLQDLFTTAQRRIVDRFKFGKVAGVNPKAAVAVENAMRESDNFTRAESMALLRRGLENYSDVLPAPVYRKLTDEIMKVEDSFHAASRAWGDEGQEFLDDLAKRITEAVPRGPGLAMGRSAASIDDLIKLVRSSSDEIKNAPWNEKLTLDSLRNLVAQGASSAVESVQAAGKSAAKLLARAEALNVPLKRARRTAQLGYRMFEQAMEESRHVPNLPTGVRQNLEALRENSSLRKDVAAALNDLRRLEGASVGQKRHFNKVGKELTRRQDELADMNRELRGRLRGAGGVAWPKLIEDADKAIRASELDIRASTRVWNKLQEDLRTAFTTRNGELGKAVKSSAKQILSGRLSLQVVDNVMQGLDPSMRPHVEKALNFHQEEMRKIPPFMRYHAKNAQELVAGYAKRPAWEHLEHSNPFYIPHQISPRLLEAMTDPRLPESVRTNLMSQFDIARSLPTSKAFLEHMAQVADDLGLEGVTDELIQTDLRALTMQRGLAFVRTQSLQKLYQDVIKIAGKEGGAWPVYEEYLNGALRPVGPRKNTFLKFLSGGDLDIPLGLAQLDETGKNVRGAKSAAFLNRSFDSPEFLEGGAKNTRVFAEVRAKDGKAFLRVRWPGLNGMYKPFLTAIPTNLRFRFRNVIAAPIMAMFHPEIKFSGLKPIWDIFKHDGLVRWSVGHFSKASAGEFSPGWWKGHRLEDVKSLASMTPEQRIAWATSTVMRATQAPSAAERMAARGALGHLQDRVGPYAWTEALDVLDEVLGRRFHARDLDLRDGINEMADLFSVINAPTHANANVLGRITRGLRKFVDFGMKISEEQETQIRTLTALNLMKKGKSPVEVVMEVNRLQVDYSIQSEVEQAVRAVIPFARYMIGATQWAADMAANPSGVGKGLMGHATSPQFLGMTQRSLSGTGENESSVLPRYAKETIALPLPWKDLEGNREFLTSLGFPQEVVINMLALTGARKETIMHNVAGGLQPLVKLPAEFLTNRNFFFGSEWGEYRKSPFLLQPFAREVPGPEGTTRYEVPGAVNELINATPMSGVESTINRLADSRQPIHLRLLNALTGFRVQGVDEEAELQKRIMEFLRSHVRSGEVGELGVFFSRLKDEDVPEEVKQVLSALEQIRAEKRRSK